MRSMPEDADFDALSEHPLMRLYRYAAKHETFSHVDAMEATGLSDRDWSLYQDKILFFREDEQRRIVYQLKAEHLLGYLDYLEMQEARLASQQASQAAKEARHFAIASILLAVVTAAVSIVLSIYEIRSTGQVELTEEQLQRIEAAMAPAPSQHPAD